MTSAGNEGAEQVRDVQVEDFGAGVVRLIVGGVSGVLSVKGTGSCDFCAAVGRDLGGVLRRVEAGLAGLMRGREGK